MVKDVILDAFASGMYVQASASLKTEVADLRTGEDGTVYASAGEAVRGQIHKIQTDALKAKIENGIAIQNLTTRVSNLETKVGDGIDELGQMIGGGA